MPDEKADLILHNGKIATQDSKRTVSEAVAIRDRRFLAVGTDHETMQYRAERTKVVDLNKRTVIPGLNDSHTHLIRGGLNYNLELRWDGVPSLADGLRMLREQALRTPPGHWVRVVGGRPMCRAVTILEAGRWARSIRSSRLETTSAFWRIRVQAPLIL